MEQQPNTSEEEEFARFQVGIFSFFLMLNVVLNNFSTQAEISNVTPINGNAESQEAEVEADDIDDDGSISELEKCLSLLEGSRCRAPYSQEWGQLGYHNALVVGVEAEGAETIDDVDVSFGVGLMKLVHYVFL